MFKYIIVLFLSLGLSFGHQDCDTLGVLFYEDIGCKPVKVDGKACPVGYECDDLTIKNDTCLFQSKIYNSGDAVDDAITERSCRVGCFCAPKAHSGKGLFTCASLDCPEWLRRPEYEPGCYPTYALGQCCSNGKKCESDADLAKCEVDGVTYNEGQKFSPEMTCLDCVCQKGFDGKLIEPFCKRRVCSEQISDSDKLAENCAPAYFDGGCHLCCPYSYACPKDTDVIKRFTDVKDSDLKCKFGKHTVKLGEGVETEADHWGKSTKVKCECIMPPFLTCTGKTE